MPDTTFAAAEDLRVRRPIPLKYALAVADRPVPTYYVVATTAPPPRTDDRERERLHKLDVAERRRFAKQIAEAAYRLPGVTEVRLTGADDELVVTVLSETRDMERDLTLQRLAIGLSQDFPDVRWSLQTREQSVTDPEESGELLPA